MRQSLLLAVVCLFVASDASAKVVTQNPHAVMSIIGDDAQTVATSGDAFANSFRIRMVDLQGQPIEGLTVQFANNTFICISMDPGCVLPLEEMYGHFAGGQGIAVVLTDANGIADSGIYFGGTVPGSYEMDVHIAFNGSARNRQILQGFPSPDARFTITQLGDTAVDSVPLGGLAFAWTLAALAGLTALRALHRSACPRATVVRRV